MAGNPILIAGAGPTGLVLALMLARRGVPFRLIADALRSRRAFPRHGRPRAYAGVLPDNLGFADEVVAQGIRTDAIHLREVSEQGVGHEVTSVGFADVGGDLSPYPFVLDLSAGPARAVPGRQAAGLGCEDRMERPADRVRAGRERRACHDPPRQRPQRNDRRVLYLWLRRRPQ